MKNILYISLGLVFVAFVGYNVYNPQSEDVVSDMILENIEAFGSVDPTIENLYGFTLNSYSIGCKICERSGEMCNIHDQEPC